MTLLVKYPHPANKSGLARAELIVESGKKDAAATKGWGQRLKEATRDNLPGVAFGEGVEQALGLDIPIKNVEAAIDSLDMVGYFADGPQAAAPNVVLATKVEGLEVRKPWRQVPELDALVAEISRKGTLITQRKSVNIPELEARDMVARLPPVR